MAMCLSTAHCSPFYQLMVAIFQALPPQLEAGIDAFDVGYREWKPQRRLHWLRTAGYFETLFTLALLRLLNLDFDFRCMEVTLNIDGVTVQKVVSNLSASVLFHFLEQGDLCVTVKTQVADHLESWTCSELAEKMDLSRGSTYKRLEWWQSQVCGLMCTTGFYLLSSVFIFIWRNYYL